jgi:hypothetical protein
MPQQAKPLPTTYIDEHLALDEFSPSGLVWKKAPRYKPLKEGKPAGYLHHSGYWDVTLKGSPFRAHRVVWYLSTGEDPLHWEVDHKNRRKGSNSPVNLRLADRSAQIQNTGKRKGCASKYKGVSIRNGRWCANARLRGVNGLLGKPVTLGYFDSEEEAWLEVIKHRPEFKKN